MSVDTENSNPELASIPPRLLALFIDYLVLNALVLISASSLGSPDWFFVLTFFTSGAYFTFCNSELCGGRTLGKRVFGLKVVSINSKSYGSLLDPAQSALRFFFSFGLLILIIELPILYFRSMSIVAPTSILELHMLVAMLFAAGSFFFACLSPLPGSFHDRFCKTLVIRHSGLPTEEQLQTLITQSESKPKYTVLAVALSFFFAGFLWSLGVFQPKNLNQVNQVKYVLENNHDIRIVSLSGTRTNIELMAIVLKKNNSPHKEIAKSLGSYLVESAVINTDEIGEITFMLFPEKKGETSNQKLYLFNTQSLQVQEKDNPRS